MSKLLTQVLRMFLQIFVNVGVNQSCVSAEQAFPTGMYWGNIRVSQLSKRTRYLLILLKTFRFAKGLFALIVVSCGPPLDWKTLENLSEPRLNGNFDFHITVILWNQRPCYPSIFKFLSNINSTLTTPGLLSFNL